MCFALSEASPRKDSILGGTDVTMHADISANTGIEGLDDVLGGGFERGRVFLLEGQPGTGKTTTALQFLLAGVASGERCLDTTFAWTEDGMHAGG